MFTVFAVSKSNPKIRITSRPIDARAFAPARGRRPTITIVATGLSKSEAKNERARVESILALLGA